MSAAQAYRSERRELLAEVVGCDVFMSRDLHSGDTPAFKSRALSDVFHTDPDCPRLASDGAVRVQSLDTVTGGIFTEPCDSCVCDSLRGGA